MYTTDRDAPRPSLDPLPSLGELSSSSPTSVVQKAYTVPPLSVSGPVFFEKKGFLHFFGKKMEKKISKKNGLTSGLTRG